MDAGHIPSVLPLAGKMLDVDGARLRVGVPAVHALASAANLAARVVVIKQPHHRDELPPAKAWDDPSEFEAAVRRQLDAMGVTATMEPITTKESRRVLRIKDQTIVGFHVALHGLSADHAIAVQTFGIGGRQRMGCGVFTPIRMVVQ